MEEKREEVKREEMKLEHSVKATKSIAYVALAIGIIAILIGIVAIISHTTASSPTTGIPSTITNSTSPGNITVIKLSGVSFITPPMSLPNAPVIIENQSFGQRLTNINEPLNASELAIINNAPNSYYEKAAEMILNGSMNGLLFPGGFSKTKYAVEVNGKPTVIYFGTITCLFCGENRWAMALALSRFGSFSELFKGYSSFGDGDLPTLYWAPAEYNSSSAMDFGNFYNSQYINFISMDYASQIRDGFQIQPLSYVLSQAQAANNSAYLAAVEAIIKNNNFQGTPYGIWGNFQVSGADAADFGNGPITNASRIPLTYMTHEGVLSQLANPNDQFAWTEYAAADLYVAAICASINNTAPVCTSIPQMKQLESII